MREKSGILYGEREGKHSNKCSYNIPDCIGENHQTNVRLMGQKNKGSFSAPPIF
jgi:hypothetical protein